MAANLGQKQNSFSFQDCPVKPVSSMTLKWIWIDLLSMKDSNSLDEPLVPCPWLGAAYPWSLLTLGPIMGWHRLQAPELGWLWCCQTKLGKSSSSLFHGPLEILEEPGGVFICRA